jgi:hypothetical protein
MTTTIAGRMNSDIRMSLFANFEGGYEKQVLLEIVDEPIYFGVFLPLHNMFINMYSEIEEEAITSVREEAQ